MVEDPVLLNDWHVVAFSHDLKAGDILPARILGEDLIAWRLGDRVMVWQDLCIHRGSRLSLGEIRGDALMCPYHGWTYNAEGRCIHIPAHPDQTPPAKARVKTYHVQERYGWIWVCLGEPAYDLPSFAEWEDTTYRNVFCGPYSIHASGPRVIENFLDVAHLPFVHAGYLGDEAYPEIDDYDVKADSNGVTATDIAIFQPNADGTGEGKNVSYTYRVYRPLMAYFVKVSAGPRFSIFATITPVDEIESIGWMTVNMNYGSELSDEDIRTFQDIIFAQDLPVVESQRPERLPLDLQAELHLRSDKIAIAYRQWLKELGLTFGTD